MSALIKAISNPILARILLNKQMEKLEKCVSHKLNVNLNLVSQKKPKKTVNLALNGGTLIGREEKLPLNGNYFAFQGVPYAEPPIGPRRYEPPVPIDTYNNRTLDCTKEGEISLQPDMFTKEIIGAESCLHLNIYTPTLAKGSKVPVMVYIHGGAYIFGSGNVAEHSPEYLVQEGVIVVTFNYRLNVMGFMHLPSGGIVGNQGFRDQRLTLKWVHENIERFGGDPNNITLFGHSAGAAAAHLHMMLPESKKYFHKAILQSGAATMDWFMQYRPEDNARRLAKIMGCTSDDDKEIGKFLREANAKKLTHKFTEVLLPVRKKRGLPLIFTAALEDKSSNAVLTETVDVKLERPEEIDIPVMMGVTEHDGMVMTAPQMKRVHLWNKEPGRFIPRTVNVDGDTDEGECKTLGDRIKHFYFKDQPVSDKTFHEFMDFMSDYNFNIPIQSAIEFHSRYQHKTSNMYYFQFSYDGELNMMKKLLGFDVKGANHGDELTYLFVMKMAEVVVSPESEAGRMRQKMCRMWTNFAKYSHPTPDDKTCDVLGDFKWEPVKSFRGAPKDEEFTLDCLDINKELKMIRDPFKKRMDFWRDVYGKYNNGFLKPKL